ncbi:MAG: flagellar hook-length control protein FliK [Proteobacteria bacterium]|nr:flagellar hook-length control protein FliK [Pseudomonadota bacterium]
MTVPVAFLSEALLPGANPAAASAAGAGVPTFAVLMATVAGTDPRLVPGAAPLEGQPESAPESTPDGPPLGLLLDAGAVGAPFAALVTNPGAAQPGLTSTAPAAILVNTAPAAPINVPPAFAQDGVPPAAPAGPAATTPASPAVAAAPASPATAATPATPATTAIPASPASAATPAVPAATSPAGIALTIAARAPMAPIGQFATAAVAAGPASHAPPAEQPTAEAAAAAGTLAPPRQAGTTTKPATLGTAPGGAAVVDGEATSPAPAQSSDRPLPALVEVLELATQPQDGGAARAQGVNPAQQQPAQAASNPPESALQAERAPSTPQPPAEQVALQLQIAIRKGLDRITIQLKPAALGTINITLDVASDGRVSAVIAADRSDTLELLQRDARGLERALQDAGLRTDSGSLSFNLRGDGHHDPADGAAPADPEPAYPTAAAEEANEFASPPTSASNHALDIEV